MYRIGVDLGGTNIAVGVISEDLKIVGRGVMKTNCPRPAEEIFDDIAKAVEMAIADAGISKEEIYYGILSPLYQFLRLDVKAEYKRYQCKANFFQNRDCNYCMKNWIKDEYEKWTELFNQGKLNDASLDFVKELMNASNRERQ